MYDVPELRQEPAPLRVLRNSPRAMPLFGILIIVMFALCTSRKQGKLKRACACGGGRDSRVQIRPFCPRHSFISLSRVQIMGFRPRRLILVCRSGPSAPVVLHIAPHVCESRVFDPVGFHGCCPELRQGPAQLRVLCNSPRAMPLSGYELVRPELTCKESALLCFH